MFQYQMSIRAKYKNSPVTPYDSPMIAMSMKGAIIKARHLNEGLKHIEIWRVTELASGETEYL